jgi:hypothetical protein
MDPAILNVEEWADYWASVTGINGSAIEFTIPSVNDYEVVALSSV